jgi:flagellar FliL protein
MAEAQPESREPSPGGGRGGLLVTVAIALLAAAAGAGGTFFFLGRDAAPAEEHAAEAGEHGEKAAGHAPATFSERVFALDPFVVNVTGEGYPRYLKLEVSFEMDSTAAREEMAARVPQVRDATLLLLSSKRLGDISDFEGKALLKDDLRERVNALLEKGRVESVLFTEFVVQ